jgi:serine/threonine protein kinase
MIAIGDVIDGKYHLKSLLGEGSMGQVFRALHVQLSKYVAIKVMAYDLANSAEYRQRFAREAKVCAQLRHPGVVGVHDVGEHQGCPFLVMDLLSGRSLRDELDQNGALAPMRAMRIAAQIADALIAAHAVRLVHRDLKPDNIVMEEADRPIIVDFGLAFIDASLSNTGRMTEHGVVLGTPSYISPEQARAVAVGPEVDVYSLGCIIFEMLSGAPPFESEGYAVLLAEHMFVEPPFLRSKAPNAPAALEYLIATMLRKEPSERPSAREVHRILIDIASGGQGTATPRVARSRVSRMVPAVARADDEVNQANQRTLGSGARSQEESTSPKMRPTAVDEGVTAVGSHAVAVLCGASRPDLVSSLMTAAAMKHLALYSIELAAGATVAMQIDAGQQRDGVAYVAILSLHGNAAIAGQAATLLPTIVMVEGDDIDDAMQLMHAGVAELLSPATSASVVASKLRKLIDKVGRRGA